MHGYLFIETPTILIKRFIPKSYKTKIYIKHYQFCLYWNIVGFWLRVLVFRWNVSTEMGSSGEDDTIDKILRCLLSFLLFREEGWCSFDFSNSDNVRLTK